MSKFLMTDKATLEQLEGIQSISIAIPRGIADAKDPLQKLTENVITSIPAHTEKHFDYEMIKAGYIVLDELERFLSKGSNEGLCLADFIPHMLQASSLFRTCSRTESFPNAATCNAAAACTGKNYQDFNIRLRRWEITIIWRPIS